MHVKKRPVGSCWLAVSLTIINKDWLGISEAGLFTCNNASTAEVCGVSLLRPLQERGAGTPALTESSGDTDSVACLCLAERNGLYHC